jgi:Ser/Thr protein kinase RdoA (MazF antagonist)
VGHAETPWTAEVAEAVEGEWGLSVAGTAERLTGGEESAAYRVDLRGGVGGVVVRLGPLTRGTAVIEWCHQVAGSVGVEEVVVPLRGSSGASVVRVGGRPVSVWPYVGGRWLDAGEPAEVEQAARVLARVHRGLREVVMPARPERSFLEFGGETGELRDEQLDRWLAGFGRRRQPLHGDYYRGNLLVDGGRIRGVIDWDEAWVGAPEVELAGAAREFGDQWSTELGRAKEFVGWYHDEGGPAGVMDDEMLVQLIRHRVRAEVAAFAGDGTDEYYDQLRELFVKLRP